MNKQGLPVMQLRGSMAVIYNETVSGGGCQLFRQQNMEKNRLKRFNGKMSAGARKRMNKAISLLVQSTKPKWVTNPSTDRMYLHKLSFVTLTVASNHNLSAREAYDRLMKHFLQWLRRTKDVKMYIWKAELQKRGQIHYHIVFREYIDHKEIRDQWNELQRREGLLVEYFEEHRHYNPNSTDIHSVRNVQKLDRYIAKELAKSFTALNLKAKEDCDVMLNNREITFEEYGAMLEEINKKEVATTGKIWDCSECLSAGKLFNVALTDRHDRDINQLLAEGKIKVVTEDFFKIILFEEISPQDLLSKEERNLFSQHLAMIPLWERGAKKEEIKVDAGTPYFLKPFVQLQHEINF